MNNNILEIVVNDNHLCFSIMHDFDLVCQVFENRFKYKPEVVQIKNGVLVVGPIKEHDSE